MPSILENLVLNSALAKDFLNPSLRTSVSIAFIIYLPVHSV